MYREEVPYQEVAEPLTTREQRYGYWSAAKGLQAVDGLAISEFAEGLGERYVEGSLRAEDVVERTQSHYADAGGGRGSAEADVVAARITYLLESTQFRLDKRSLFAIHGSLFRGVLPDDWVGVPRTTNIVKPEPVLGGRSVSYADHRQIQMQLDYDFGEEASRRRLPPLTEGQLPSLARFVANVWQTHPFREGNTRASAVFLELYLRSLGVEVDNSPFESHSCYFRDALVRASFSSIELGVDEDLSFLVRFLGNVALGQDNALEPGEMDVHGIRVDPGVEYRGGNPPLSQADRSPAPPRAERERRAAR